MVLLEHRLLILWVSAAAICFLTATLFAFLAVRARDRSLALFSLSSLLIGSTRVVDLLARQSVDATGLILTERWWAGFAIVQAVVLLYFAVSFTGVFKRWIVWPITVLAAALFIANLFLPYTVFYSYVSDFRLHPLSWGETWPLLDVELGAWSYLFLSMMWASILYAIATSISLYRRGERASGLTMFVGFASIIAGGLHDSLLYTGNEPPDFAFPFPIAGLSYIGFVLAMGFEMSNRVAEATVTRRSLAQTKADYRRLVEQAADGFLVHTADTGKILDANHQASVMLGYPHAELMAKRIDELVGAEQYETLLSTWQALKADAPVTFDSVFRRKDGTTIPVELRFRLTVQKGSQIVVVLARDVSEKVQAENERRSLEAQVQRAQKMEALGTLTGGIAHDFNNILTAVMGYTNLALPNVEGRTASHLQQVLQAGERATKLVRQILTFSRQTSEDAAPVELKSIIEESLRLLRASVSPNIEFVSQYRSESLVVADSTQIQQVLVNLCTNAAQAVEETGGTVTVELDEVEPDEVTLDLLPALTPQTYMRIRVSDDGPGIPRHLQSRVFEPFFTTKGEGKGTGLGLSVVHGIVKQHGGDIRLNSEPGKGATFEVYLPRTQSRAVPASGLRNALPQGSEKILVVDDEPSIARLMKETLRALGYRVDARTSSLEAANLFRSFPERYDLVITDSAMPEMTGSQLAREILAVSPETPVILCSGFSATMDSDRARDMGIRAYLRKPIPPMDLAGTIRSVLDAPLAAETAEQ